LRRRSFLTLLGGAAASWPLAARAQQPVRMRRIGVLMSAAQDDRRTQLEIAAFEQALQSLSWTKGRNIEIIYRYGAGDDERFHSYASELVGQNPDVLLANSGSALRPLRRLTSTIPIVVASAGDLVDTGNVQSLARPGGNITGFMSFEFAVGGKWLALLREMAPATSRVMVIESADAQRGSGSYFPSIVAMARMINVDAIMSKLHDDNDIDPTIEQFAHGANGGLIVLPSPFTIAHRRSLIDAAARNRLPAIYPYRDFADDGGLMAYGSNAPDLFRRAGGYVDRILKGESPANLPVQAPTKYELVINLKTAKALGLTVPLPLQASADEVIE
jgi:putative tryptophan/tyrosine transport system substrate-binding protein